MIFLSAYVRMVYAHTFLYGQRSLRTISEYVTSVEYYLQIVGDVPLDEIDPAKNARLRNKGRNGAKSILLKSSMRFWKSLI